jgi:putative tricarboxylic transport membrane protein
MNEKTLTRADFVSAIVLILAGGYIALDSWRMPRFTEKQTGAWSAPGLVPGLLGLLFVLMGAILLVRSVRRGGHHLGITARAVAAFLRERSTQAFLITLALCLLYAVGFMGRLPYAAGTALFVFLFIYVTDFQRGRPLRRELVAVGGAGIVAVATSAVVTLVFEKLFLVTLP